MAAILKMKKDGDGRVKYFIVSPKTYKNIASLNPELANEMGFINSGVESKPNSLYETIANKIKSSVDSAGNVTISDSLEQSELSKNTFAPETLDPSDKTNLPNFEI